MKFYKTGGTIPPAPKRKDYPTDREFKVAEEAYYTKYAKKLALQKSEQIKNEAYKLDSEQVKAKKMTKPVSKEKAKEFEGKILKAGGKLYKGGGKAQTEIFQRFLNDEGSGKIEGIQFDEKGRAFLISPQGQKTRLRGRGQKAAEMYQMYKNKQSQDSISENQDFTKQLSDKLIGKAQLMSAPTPTVNTQGVKDYLSMVENNKVKNSEVKEPYTIPFDDMTFNEAFKTATDRGMYTFMWKGKRYTTEQAPEYEIPEKEAYLKKDIYSIFK